MPASPHTIRERGLVLVGRVNRWLIAGAVALSGALSIVAAGAFHGHTKRSSAGAGVVRSHSSGGGNGGSTAGSTGGNTAGGSSSGGTGGLQPPAQAPSSSSGGGGGVVSGAS